MSSTSIEPKRKIPLDWAASELSRLCELVDEQEDADIDEALVAQFHETSLAVKEAVDRRILFWKFVESQIPMAKEMEQLWRKRRKALESIFEKFKENTKAIMEANPGLPYQGEHGKLSLRNNPDKLKLSFETEIREVTMRNVVSLAVLDQHRVPAKYVTKVELYTIDKESLKKDLQAAGGWFDDFDAASLDKGKHVRVTV